MSRSFVAASSQKLETSTTPITSSHPLTMHCWFQVTGTAAGNNVLMTLGNITAGQFDFARLYAVPGGTLRFGIDNSNVAATTTNVSNNVWYSACGVSSSATSRAVFLNGGSKGTNTVNATSSGYDIIELGVLRTGTFTGEYLDGLIAHPAIWNVGLTDEEVQMLAAGASPLRVRPQSLVFYAPYLGRDTSEIDIIGGRALTVTNATASNNEPRALRAMPARGIISGSSSAIPPPPPTPPAAPSGLTATPLSSTQIQLTWVDNSTTEDGFKIERSVNGVSYAQIATTGANVTTYTDTGLSPSTTYYYRVRAYNAGGDSAYSAAANATTSAPPVPSATTFPQLGMYWIGQGRVQLPATYSQSGTTITVTMANHGLTAGGNVVLTITSGGATGGSYTVAGVTNDNVFTVTSLTSTTTSGNLTVRGSFLNQYQSATGIEMMRKRHLVVINGFPELAGYRRYQNAAIVTAVKVASTIGTKIYMYWDTDAVRKDPGAFETLRAKIAAQNWYVYANGSSGTPLNSYFSSSLYAINVTDFVPPDSAGRNAMEWRADYEPSWIWGGAENNTAGAAFDGMFLDNILIRPRINGDYNRDGVTDNATNPVVAGWFQNGLVSGVTWFNANPANATKTLIANCADWFNSADWGLGPLSSSVYWKAFDGGVFEFAIGASFSVETWGSTAKFVSSTQLTEDALKNPALGMFQAMPTTGGATNYKDMRHAMTACLAICNMPFAYAEAYEYATSMYPWYDEYDFNLGEALEPRKTAATQNGIWRRDFQNGIVLWCPKGVTGTINLGGTFYRLTGSQDPSVNNGAAVTSVTFSSARDGLILSRTPT